MAYRPDSPLRTRLCRSKQILVSVTYGSLHRTKKGKLNLPALHKSLIRELGTRRGFVFPTLSSRGRAIYPRRAVLFTVRCPSVSRRVAPFGRAFEFS